MKKYIYLSAALMLALYAFGAQEVVADQVPLELFLQKAGYSCRIYFTLEGAYEGTNRSTILLGEKVTVQGLPTNVESVILAVTNSITNLTVKADAANKLIYHIIDKRLLAPNDYAMNDVLASIEFEGTAYDLVDHIKERSPKLLNETVSLIGHHASNAITKISIDAKNVSVRDALSNGVNLDGYSWLVWSSFTSLETLQTEVHYYGDQLQPLLDLFPQQNGRTSISSSRQDP